MSDNPFAQPAPPSSGISWGDHLGALVLVEPASYEQAVETQHGTTDAIRAEIYVIDGPSGGAVFNDTLIFGRGLVAQLRPRIGQKVLGRVGQGEKQPGKNPPWLLQEATPQDIQMGTQFLQQRPANQFSAPAQTQPAPAQQQAQQPAQQGGQVPF